MTLEFHNEVLNIEGQKISGTIVVNCRVTDSSFSHAFGTDYLMECEYTPGGFIPDGKERADGKAGLRAVSTWIDNNLDLLGREFDKQRDS